MCTCIGASKGCLLNMQTHRCADILNGVQHGVFITFARCAV